LLKFCPPVKGPIIMIGFYRNEIDSLDMAIKKKADNNTSSALL